MSLVVCYECKKIGDIDTIILVANEFNLDEPIYYYAHCYTCCSSVGPAEKSSNLTKFMIVEYKENSLNDDFIIRKHKHKFIDEKWLAENSPNIYKKLLWWLS